MNEDILDRARRRLHPALGDTLTTDWALISDLCGEVERLREALANEGERIIGLYEEGEAPPVIPDEIADILLVAAENAQCRDCPGDYDPDKAKRIRRFLASPKAVPTKDLREKIEALPRYAFDFSEATVVCDGWLISREAVLALIAGNVPETPLDAPSVAVAFRANRRLGNKK